MNRITKDKIESLLNQFSPDIPDTWNDGVISEHEDAFKHIVCLDIAVKKSICLYLQKDSTAYEVTHKSFDNYLQHAWSGWKDTGFETELTTWESDGFYHVSYKVIHKKQ